QGFGGDAFAGVPGCSDATGIGGRYLFAVFKARKWALCDDAICVLHAPGGEHFNDSNRPFFVHHFAPPTISVATGNLNVCPTRSRPESTPGLASPYRRHHAQFRWLV